MRPAPPAATLRGLRYFAEHCPALSDISILVNASGEHWAEAAATMPPVHRTNAVSLDLIYSPVTSPEAVAVYLQRSFRSFERVRFLSPPSWLSSQDQDDMWRAWARLRGILLADENV
ncbi:hypothetical protein NUW54_g12910 [Trametes sanguinea]|uniref:Uncharacterized protein n=1 Tax=Trametes sanguinea TaxID=158606 RepID=A0ACC1MS60_9APHY|nr:hypothetical protein NUW54_g12910 [Trametes sanguinea]